MRKGATRAGKRADRVSVLGVSTYLWFDRDAEEAARFYTGLLRPSKIHRIDRGPDGRAFVVSFELAGHQMMALNGGPQFRFNESASIFVRCRGQREVDRLWTALLRGGRPSQCGWLKDRFGLSWQIIPERLGELLTDPDPGRAGRAMAAMMKMSKIDVAKLEAAADAD